MKRFIEGESRTQSTMFPERLDDYIDEDNPVRVIDYFIDELDLLKLGFASVQPHATGWPGYHPSVLVKIYVYGYFNRIHSSRRLEKETNRNIEMMWLTSRLTPDFKTIADFRKDNGPAIRKVCSEFVSLCRQMNLFSSALAAIDGSKFKAVNNRDKNFSKAKMARHRENRCLVLLPIKAITKVRKLRIAKIAALQQPIFRRQTPREISRRVSLLGEIFTT